LKLELDERFEKFSFSNRKQISYVCIKVQAKGQSKNWDCVMQKVQIVLLSSKKDIRESNFWSFSFPTSETSRWLSSQIEAFKKSRIFIKVSFWKWFRRYVGIMVENWPRDLNLNLRGWNLAPWALALNLSPSGWKLAPCGWKWASKD
jgi:hypothetical protein